VGTRRRESQFIIHQYDEINRDLTWLTLSADLPAWKVSLRALIDDAAVALDAGD
jgi:uncharacterized protein with HEPN domain